MSDHPTMRLLSGGRQAGRRRQTNGKQTDILVLTGQQAEP